MSAETKLEPLRPDKKVKDFFAERLAEPVVLPDELIPDGKFHWWKCGGKLFSYTAGFDAEGPFIAVTRSATYRPPVSKIRRAQLRCILGGKS